MQPIDYGTVELWEWCVNLACPLEHQRDDENTRRHQLPADHPRVVELNAAHRARIDAIR